MRKIEGSDRYVKVSTWCMFAGVAMLGIIMRPHPIPANITSVAADKADELLAELEKRLPVEDAKP